MKDYFYLQYIMTNRKMKEAGLPPLLGYLFVLIAFVLLSAYVFQKTDFAKYLVILISLSSIFKLSENTRADFLLSTFGDKIKMQIRILENTILCLPFVLLLLYKSCFLEASMLFLSSLLLSLFTLQSAFHFTIPTPFSKNPFEFSTGFRKSFFLFPIVYALTFMAIKVDNFNLGLFSMLLIFLVAMSYYPTPENEFFVWVHADSPKSFLKKKMTVALSYVMLLASPILISLLIFYPMEFEKTLLFLLISVLLLPTIILAKYTAYPTEINFPEVIKIALCLFFPPLFVVMIPYLYFKAGANLNYILNDSN
jgi:TRAP-type mannitol/chloroaromatic compound transport system permease small subunit